MSHWLGFYPGVEMMLSFERCDKQQAQARWSQPRTKDSGLISCEVIVMDNKHQQRSDTKKKSYNDDEDPKTEREWREMMGEFKDRYEKRGGVYRKSGKRKL